MEYLFLLPNKSHLKITAESLERMERYIQDESQKTEGGGVLLGRFIRYTNNVIVDKVSLPMIGDKRQRHYFKRGEKRHQKVINNAWKKSRGTCNYLGEWHTHPENYPTPSRTDIRGWKEKLKIDKFHGDFLYFVIVGIKTTRLWIGNKQDLSITKAKKVRK